MGPCGKWTSWYHNSWVLHMHMHKPQPPPFSLLFMLHIHSDHQITLRCIWFLITHHISSQECVRCIKAKVWFKTEAGCLWDAEAMSDFWIINSTNELWGKENPLESKNPYDLSCKALCSLRYVMRCSHLTTAALWETVQPPVNNSLTYTHTHSQLDLQKSLAHAAPVWL